MYLESIGLPSHCHHASVWLCRDRERLEAKYREQLDALTSRAGDLDTENRQLRSLKYELDTKVQQADWQFEKFAACISLTLLPAKAAHTLACGLGSMESGCKSFVTDKCCKSIAHTMLTIDCAP